MNCSVLHKLDEFMIDFDDIYTWIEFTRKDNAKRLLEKSFKENIDYKLDEGSFPPDGGKPIGGRPSIDLLLTIDYFKENIDYQIDKPNFPASAGKLRSRPTEKILLNIETFKMFCMIATTEESKKDI